MERLVEPRGGIRGPPLHGYSCSDYPFVFVPENYPDRCKVPKGMWRDNVWFAVAFLAVVGSQYEYDGGVYPFQNMVLSALLLPPHLIKHVTLVARRLCRCVKRVSFGRRPCGCGAGGRAPCEKTCRTMCAAVLCEEALRAVRVHVSGGPVCGYDVHIDGSMRCVEAAEHVGVLRLLLLGPDTGAGVPTPEEFAPVFWRRLSELGWRSPLSRRALAELGALRAVADKVGAASGLERVSRSGVAAIRAVNVLAMAHSPKNYTQLGKVFDNLHKAWVPPAVATDPAFARRVAKMVGQYEGAAREVAVAVAVAWCLASPYGGPIMLQMLRQSYDLGGPEDLTAELVKVFTSDPSTPVEKRRHVSHTLHGPVLTLLLVMNQYGRSLPLSGTWFGSHRTALLLAGLLAGPRMVTEAVRAGRDHYWFAGLSPECCGFQWVRDDRPGGKEWSELVRRNLEQSLEFTGKFFRSNLYRNGRVCIPEQLQPVVSDKWMDSAGSLALVDALVAAMHVFMHRVAPVLLGRECELVVAPSSRGLGTVAGAAVDEEASIVVCREVEGGVQEQACFRGGRFMRARRVVGVAVGGWTCPFVTRCWRTVLGGVVEDLRKGDTTKEAAAHKILMVMKWLEEYGALVLGNRHTHVLFPRREVRAGQANERVSPIESMEWYAKTYADVVGGEEVAAVVRGLETVKGCEELTWGYAFEAWRTTVFHPSMSLAYMLLDRADVRAWTSGSRGWVIAFDQVTQFAQETQVYPFQV